MEVTLKKTLIYIVFQLSIISGYHFGKWEGLLTKIQGYIEILGIQGEGNIAFMVTFMHSVFGGKQLVAVTDAAQCAFRTGPSCFPPKHRSGK